MRGFFGGGRSNGAASPRTGSQTPGMFRRAAGRGAEEASRGHNTGSPSNAGRDGSKEELNTSAASKGSTGWVASGEDSPAPGGVFSGYKASPVLRARNMPQALLGRTSAGESGTGGAGGGGGGAARREDAASRAERERDEFRAVAQRAAEHCKALALELNEAREEVARLRARGAAPADRLNRANPATVLPRWCQKQVSELEAERRWRTCRVRFDPDAPPADVAPLCGAGGERDDRRLLEQAQEDVAALRKQRDEALAELRAAAQGGARDAGSGAVEARARRERDEALAEAGQLRAELRASEQRAQLAREVAGEVEELRAERDAAQLSLSAALAAAKAKGGEEGQGWLGKAEVAQLREQRDQAIQLMQKEVEMREVATRELMEARDALEASQRAEGAAREAAADARRAAQEAAQQRGAATTTSEVHAEAVMELVDARETAARSLALAKALLLGHDLDPSERFDAARDPLAWMKQDPVEEDGVPDEESGCHLLCSRALTDMTSFHLSAKAFVTDITMCIPEDFEARDAVVLRQAVAAVLDARHNHEVALRLEACSLAEHLAAHLKLTGEFDERRRLATEARAAMSGPP